MGSGGFYAFLTWTAFVFGLGYFWGNGGYESTLEEGCNSKHEMVISGTVYTCKPVALVVKGQRAELTK